SRPPARGRTRHALHPFHSGFLFWGGGSRRFIYAPAKLDPNAANRMANKFAKMVAAPGVAPFLRWRRYRWTTDLDYASGPRTNREPEVVQLYNRGHEVQAET